jgi:predicted O-methyltransferase YrrM
MTEEKLMDPRITQHIEQLVPQRPDVLVEMEKIAAEKDFPIIGPAVGQLCYQLTRTIGAKQVFELGSGFGYSTAWFARGIRENGGGTVHHTVWEQEMSDQARGYLSRLGYNDLVQFHVGESVAALRDADGPFDIVFNDIDKEDYPASLDAIAPKLRSGGILIVDNLLWYGRIFDSKDKSEATRGVQELTRRIARNPDWISSLVPIRDGVLVAFKR